MRREALSVARSRGVKLGNPNGAEALRRAGKGGAPLREAIARNADRHAQDLVPVVEDVRAGGATSLPAIAAELCNRIGALGVALHPTVTVQLRCCSPSPPGRQDANGSSFGPQQPGEQPGLTAAGARALCVQGHAPRSVRNALSGLNS